MLNAACPVTLCNTFSCFQFKGDLYRFLLEVCWLENEAKSLHHSYVDLFLDDNFGLILI